MLWLGLLCVARDSGAQSWDTARDSSTDSTASQPATVTATSAADLGLKLPTASAVFADSAGPAVDSGGLQVPNTSGLHMPDSAPVADSTRQAVTTASGGGDFVSLREELYRRFRDTLTLPEVPEPLWRHYVTVSEGVYANAIEDYRHAESLFASLSVVEPHHPMGPLMQAATLNVEMVDNELYLRQDEFWTLLDIAEARAKSWLKSKPEDSWALCCLGHVYGYRAVWEGRFGSWFAALKRGLNARGAYDHALEADSNCMDVYIGIGSYHYWKSAKSEFINWLPLVVKDDKSKGIAEMKVALKRGWLSQGAAAAGLVAIYMHRKAYGSALELAREWQAVYPQGKAFLWGQAYALFALERDREALAAFDSVKARLQMDSGQGWYNHIEVDYHRAELFERMGDSARAGGVRDTVLMYPASEEERKRQKDKLKGAEMRKGK